MMVSTSSDASPKYNSCA